VKNVRLVIVLAVAILAVQPAGAQRYKTPRTPWGDPDLQGLWSNQTSTPLERPDALKDKETLTQLVHAAMSQFGQDRVPFNVAAGIARSLVSTPNDDEPEAAPVMVSDVPEVDAGELAPAAHVGGVSGAASAMRSCAQDPIGLAQTPAQTPAAATVTPAEMKARHCDIAISTIGNSKPYCGL